MKLKSLKKTNGRLEKSANTEKSAGTAPLVASQAFNVDTFFGANGSEKFGTTDESVFLDRLNSLAPSDLYSYAVKFGYVYSDLSNRAERKRIIDNLVSDFRKHINTFKNNGGTTVTQGKNAKIDEIMKFAR